MYKDNKPFERQHLSGGKWEPISEKLMMAVLRKTFDYKTATTIIAHTYKGSTTFAGEYAFRKRK